jgi:hypothetical protein
MELHDPSKHQSVVVNVISLHFLTEVIVREWIDTVVFVGLALGNGVEGGDSEGSGLTRAALILLYAMVDAQLAIVSQWRIAEDAWFRPCLPMTNPSPGSIHLVRWLRSCRRAPGKSALMSGIGTKQEILSSKPTFARAEQARNSTAFPRFGRIFASCAAAAVRRSA